MKAAIWVNCITCPECGRAFKSRRFRSKFSRICPFCHHAFVSESRQQVNRLTGEVRPHRKGKNGSISKGALFKGFCSRGFVEY